MADIRITDLVDEKVFDDLNRLSEDIKELKQQYIEAAQALAGGLNMKIGTQGDLDKFNELVAENAKKAQQATEQLNTTIDKQRVIVGQTTNEISRELAEIGKENKEKRDAYEQDKSAVGIAESLLGTRQQNILRLAELQTHLNSVKKAQKDLDDQEKSGAVSSERAMAVRANLIAKQREFQAAIKDLNLVLNNQEKQMQASEGSYQKLSLQLEFLKKAYKGLSDEEKNSDIGKTLGEEIGNLDAHLKDLAADMGEFQRNTGNYAIANQNVKTELRELVQEIAMLTIQYRNMSDEEKASAAGTELSEKIREMTERASELRDTVDDVNTSIKSGANDTGTFSAFSEGLNMVISGVGGLTAASHALGIGEKDLIKIQTNLQAALAASNALTQAQTALQGESNLMVGVARVQQMAHAAAIKMKTAAESESVIVSKAATVAQAAFNAVAKANPYVLLATGIGLLIAAVVGFTKATKSETEEQKKAREEMEKSRKEYEDFIDVEKRLQEAREKGIESCSDEIAKLQLLYSAATDTARSVEERKKAVDKLQELYPSYFANLKDEIIMNGKAISSYNELTNAILQRAIAQGKQKVLEEYTAAQYEKERELLIVMEKQAEAQERLKKAKEAYDKAMEEANTINQTPQAFSPEEIIDARLRSITEKDKVDSRKEYEEAKASVDELNTKIVRLGTEIRDAKEASDELTKSMSMSEVLNAVGKGKTATPKPSKTEKEETTKTYEEIREVVLEHTQEILAERIKMTEKGSKEEYDLTLQYIHAEQELREIEINKTYTKQKAEIEKALESERKVLDKSLAEKKISRQEYNEVISKYSEKLAGLENARLEQIVIASQKADRAREKSQKEYSEAYIASMQKTYAEEQDVRQLSYTREITELTKRRSSRIITEEEYQQQLAQLQMKFAEDTANKQIEMLEKVLDAEGLTADQRAKITKELDAIRVKSAKDVADAELRSTKQVEKQEADLAKRRESDVKKYLKNVTDMVRKVSKLVSTIYDGQIKDIEDEQEVAEQAHEREVERIEQLEETGAISKEEAEARKRAAEQRSAEKNEELEKKKAEIKHKQAVWDKAASISEAIIATSLGVAEALKLTWPMNLVIAALVGAMGAAEIATIIATPIATYAKGTKDKEGHPGGLAVVGDAGKKEAVVYEGKMWITPDTPTVINLPKGAIVYPDADNMPEPFSKKNMPDTFNIPKEAIVYPKTDNIQPSVPALDVHTTVQAPGVNSIYSKDERLLQPVFMTVTPSDSSPSPVVIVNNDTKRLEKGIKQTNQLIKQSIIMQKRIAYDAAYQNYKMTRL